MDLLATLQIAYRSLFVNKMRSILTMLGIIIGVGAVIAMVSLSQGATAGITERIASMGSNLLMVRAGGGGFGAGPIRGGGNSSAQISMLDVEAIKELPLVKYVAPEASISSATVAAGSNTWTTEVDGTTPELQMIKSWPTSQGSFFDQNDVDNASAVAVLGQTAADNLFPDNSMPLGQIIRINGLDFAVIGLLTTKGSGGMGNDQDDIIYIPLTTAQQRLLGSQTVRMVNVQAESQEAVAPLQDFINNLLRQRHRLADSAENDFTVQNMAELLSTIEDTTKIMTFLLGGIAAVSLVVGGIGIMNIMLVSVTERTREIGIRMAIGATTRDILTQFLIEALLLSLIGGIIGVLLGWGLSWILGMAAGWKMSIAPWLVFLSLGFAMCIGLFFGYYPARKAANSNPIDALRFE
jgi:putative ABC transport system permease protein